MVDEIATNENEHGSKCSISLSAGPGVEFGVPSRRQRSLVVCHFGPAKCEICGDGSQRRGGELSGLAHFTSRSGFPRRLVAGGRQQAEESSSLRRRSGRERGGKAVRRRQRAERLALHESVSIVAMDRELSSLRLISWKNSIKSLSQRNLSNEPVRPCYHCGMYATRISVNCLQG